MCALNIEYLNDWPYYVSERVVCRHRHFANTNEVSNEGISVWNSIFFKLSFVFHRWHFQKKNFFHLKISMPLHLHRILYEFSYHFQSILMALHWNAVSVKLSKNDNNNKNTETLISFAVYAKRPSKWRIQIFPHQYLTRIGVNGGVRSKLIKEVIQLRSKCSKWKEERKETKEKNKDRRNNIFEEKKWMKNPYFQICSVYYLSVSNIYV